MTPSEREHAIFVLVTQAFPGATCRCPLLMFRNSRAGPSQPCVSPSIAVHRRILRRPESSVEKNPEKYWRVPWSMSLGVRPKRARRTGAVKFTMTDLVDCRTCHNRGWVLDANDPEVAYLFLFLALLLNASTRESH